MISFRFVRGYAYCLLSVIISESMTLNLSSGFVIVQQIKFMVNYKTVSLNNYAHYQIPAFLHNWCVNLSLLEASLGETFSNIS